MKKILSFLAACALALGLIGCSGDLHDDALNPIDTSKFETFELCGAMTGWNNNAGTNLKFTPTDNQYEYSVTFTALGAEQGFCFITKTGLWDDYQIGGESMAAGTLPEGISFSSKAGEGKHEDAILSGLRANAIYKMTVETSTGIFKVSLTEEKEPNYFLLEGYFVRSRDKDWNGTGSNLVWNPVKDPATGVVTYKVEFTATKTTQQLALGRQDWDAGRWECSEATSFAVGAEPITLEKGKEQHPEVTGLIVGRPYNVVITTTPDEVVQMTVEQIKYIDVVGFKVINADDYEGKYVYFLEKWIPENKWGKDNPKATVTGGTAEVSIKSTRLTVDSIPLQMTAPDDPDAGFWAIKVGGGTKYVDNAKDFKTYIITYDCEADELSLVEKE